MQARSKFLASLLLLIGAGGCHPAFREERDAEGDLIRTEYRAEAEPDANAAEMNARMAAYRNSSATPEGASRSLAAARSTFDPFIERDCPPEGSATTERKMESNRLKNRAEIPAPEDIDPLVSLDALRADGDDRDRWSTARAGVIEGYIRKAASTGPESCNCRKSAKRLTDMHMDVVADEHDSVLPVVVEITPIHRLLHEHHGLEDWSSRVVRDKYLNKRVRITGWLFYDTDHEDGAENTDPGDGGGENNWRATAWELHPVTNIELIE